MMLSKVLSGLLGISFIVKVYAAEVEDGDPAEELLSLVTLHVRDQEADQDYVVIDIPQNVFEQSELLKMLAGHKKPTDTAVKVVANPPQFTKEHLRDALTTISLANRRNRALHFLSCSDRYSKIMTALDYLQLNEAAEETTLERIASAFNQLPEFLAQKESNQPLKQHNLPYDEQFSLAIKGFLATKQRSRLFDRFIDTLPSQCVDKHLNRVTAVVWSPDNKWFLTASEDGTARVWEHNDKMKKWESKYFLMSSGLPIHYAALAVGKSDQKRYILIASSSNSGVREDYPTSWEAAWKFNQEEDVWEIAEKNVTHNKYTMSNGSIPWKKTRDAAEGSLGIAWKDRRFSITHSAMEPHLLRGYLSNTTFLGKLVKEGEMALATVSLSSDGVWLTVPKSSTVIEIFKIPHLDDLEAEHILLLNVLLQKYYNPADAGELPAELKVYVPEVASSTGNISSPEIPRSLLQRIFKGKMKKAGLAQFVAANSLPAELGSIDVTEGVSWYSRTMKSLQQKDPHWYKTAENLISLYATRSLRFSEKE